MKTTTVTVACDKCGNVTPTEFVEVGITYMNMRSEQVTKNKDICLACFDKLRREWIILVGGKAE